jgi:hypothetical protein
MLALSVQPLEPKSPWLAQIAADQFEYWGPLTSHSSRGLVRVEATLSAALPRVLIASSRGTLLGSVNLLTNEMPARLRFTINPAP